MPFSKNLSGFRDAQNTKFLTPNPPLIPGLRFIFKIQAVSLFLIIDPQLNGQFQKKLIIVSEISKDGRTTDTWTRTITKDPVK